MMYFLNLDEASDLLPVFYFGLCNFVSIAAILIVLGCGFIPYLRRSSPYIKKALFICSVVFFLLSGLLSSYEEFKYFKTVFRLEGRNLDVSILYQNHSLVSEMYEYVGLAMALYLFLIALVVRRPKD